MKATAADLDDHALVSEVIARGMAVYSAAGVKNLREMEACDLDEHEFYLVRVAFSLVQFVSWIHQLHMALEPIRKFKSWRKKQPVEAR